ncbi:hypothetical protein ACIQXW_16305 [Lysinibacillus sp. NPDC097162]|uniref:hypothetical protein n=1 Tax=Lysinibacillus sp. NPDC097162 TaxID=3364140 RepID=UPI0038066724
MNPIFLGFGVKPYAIVIWRDGDEAKSKTICFDELDLQVALAMHADAKGFYHQYEPKVYYAIQRENLIA